MISDSQKVFAQILDWGELGIFVSRFSKIICSDEGLLIMAELILSIDLKSLPSSPFKSVEIIFALPDR